MYLICNVLFHNFFTLIIFVLYFKDELYGKYIKRLLGENKGCILDL